MPLSTDIRLPRDHTPLFPDRCCRCMTPSPGDVLPVAVRSGSWWDWLTPLFWWFRRPVRLEVPICSGCRGPAIRHRRLRLLALIVVAALVIPWVSVWTKKFGWSRQWGKLAALGGFVVAGLPVFAWFTVRPLVVDLTVRKNDIDYEFANAEYAMAFHLHNPQGVCDDWGLDDLTDPDDRPV